MVMLLDRTPLPPKNLRGGGGLLYWACVLPICPREGENFTLV